MNALWNTILCSAALLLLFAFWQGYGLRYNQSESLPHTLYFAMPGSPSAYGQILTFRLDKSPVTFAKIIAGVPGDYIEVKNNKIYINKIEKAEIITTLTPILGGVIPSDFFFVLGSHSKSFDSRYAEFGLVPKHAFIERLWPIF